MPTPHALCCYDYVNHSYPRVRDALLANPNYVFRHATAAAAAHAATLHVQIGAVDIGADVAIRIDSIEQARAYGKPATKLRLTWEAVRTAALFPTMTATLVVFPLSSTETQLELDGHYDPPMGKLGDAIDAALGHRLAEASVNQFIRQVAGWLREELAVPSAVVEAAPGAVAR